MMLDPSQVIDWATIVLTVALAASTLALIVSLTRSAVKSQAARQAAVSRLLANPQLLQRVWFVQREYNTHHEVLLRGRDQAGKEVTLAFPSEAPAVWHKLQLAGILVHPEP
jgi:muconolactone delta-isomerase